MIKEVFKSTISEFEYRRYSFNSKILKKDVFFGVVRPLNSTQCEESIYFLHGGNGNDEQFIAENLLQQLSAQTISMIKERNIQIILPGIEISFLKEASLDSGNSYSDFFLKELLPQVEMGQSIENHCRSVTGVSMGGHAALNIFLRHPNLFSGVGALFPGIAAFNPFDLNESNEYLQRTQIAPAAFELLVASFKIGFSNEAEYLNHDPLTLIRSMAPETLRGKEIYIRVGTLDEFGLYEGSKRFCESLALKNIQHDFSLVEGGRHDASFAREQINSMLFKMALTGRG